MKMVVLNVFCVDGVNVDKNLVIKGNHNMCNNIDEINIDDVKLPEIPNIPISDNAVLNIYETMCDIKDISDQGQIDIVDNLFDLAQFNESVNPTK